MEWHPSLKLKYLDMHLPVPHRKITEEKQLINETVLHLPTVPMQISTGLSPAYDFLPTVKLTYIAPHTKDNISISFLDIDWYDMFDNMLSISPTHNEDGTMSENAINFQDFKLTGIPCEGQKLVKLEKHNDVLYFCKEWLQEINFFYDIINHKLKLLKNIDFSSHYNSVLLYITKYDSDVVYSERINNVCSLNPSIQNCCMLEYLALDYNQILCDITKILYID